MRTSFSLSICAVLCTFLATAFAVPDLKYCNGGAEGKCLGITLSTRDPHCYAFTLEVGQIDTVVGVNPAIEYTLYTGGGCTGTPSSSFNDGTNALETPFKNSVASVKIELTESAWQWLGCHVDFGPRTLAGANKVHNGLTVASCQDFCAGGGFKYAGVEFGNECWCDHAIGTTGALADDCSSCNMACGGEETEACGGSNRINIYFNNNGLPGPANKETIGSGAFTFQGCYTDSVSARVLQHRFDIPQSAGGVTPETCAAVCTSNNFSVVGLEFGQECWCGPSLASTSTKTDDIECRSACSSDPGSFCGAADRLSIWSKDAL